MGTYTLATFRTNLRLDLSDAGTFWSDGEIDRAVIKAVHYLSRYIPKVTMTETRWDKAVSDETLAISSSAGTVSYPPVEPKSETITSTDGATTYVRDTNYTINYFTGVVTEITGMDDGDYTIDYTREDQILGISSLLSDTPTRIISIEHPVGYEPPAIINAYTWLYNYLLFKGEDNVLRDNESIRIIYETMWTDPAAATASDYPESLDNVVAIGAAGFLLLMRYEKYVQAAITEIGLANAAADSMATPLADINTALDKIATNITAAGTAADKIATYLTNNSNEDAKYWLTKITTDIAGLRTAVLTALDAANAHLDEVDTTDLSGAETLLAAGDDLINTVTTGVNVAGGYAQFINSWQNNGAIRVNAGLGFIQEAATRLANLTTYIEQAKGWMTIADGFSTETGHRISMALSFAREAEQRILEAEQWARQADRYMTTAQGYTSVADRYLVDAQQRLVEFYTAIGAKSEAQGFQNTSLQYRNYPS